MFRLFIDEIKSKQILFIIMLDFIILFFVVISINSEIKNYLNLHFYLVITFFFSIAMVDFVQISPYKNEFILYSKMPFTLKELFIKRNVILIYISIIIILISFILNSISDEKNSLKTLFSVILYISMFIGYLVFLDIKSIKNTISTKQYIFKLIIWMMTYLIISMGILYLHFEILNRVDNAILRLFLMFLNNFILFCFYYQSFKRRKSFKF